MKHLVNLLKQVEIDIRSDNQLSRDTYNKLSEIPEWDFRIVNDFILRVRMSVQANNLNFVYKIYENQEQYDYDKEKSVDLIIASLRRDELDTVLTDITNRLYIPNGITHDTIEIWGMQVTQARNLAVKEASKRGAKYLLFIDDDIIAPNNAVQKLFDLMDKTQRHVVAADYMKKIEPSDSAHVYGEEIEPGVYECDLCAMGFTLIDLSVVGYHVPFPLFWEFGAPDGYWLMGEDAFFTMNLGHYLNEKPLVDTSIHCLHYDKTWHKIFGTRDKEVTYATNAIETLDQFERLRVPLEYPKIGICIPTRDENSPIACKLEKLHCLRGYQSILLRTWDKPVDEARTDLVKQAIKEQCDYVLFIDDDVVPSVDALCKMTELIERDDIDIINGDYLLKGEPQQSIHLHLDNKGMVNELERIEDLPELFEMNWLAGLGICLIDINIFKQAREPWFRCYSKDINTDSGVNEDASFFQLAHNNGFRIWCDRSIQCLHIDFNNQKVYSTDPNYDLRNYAG